MCGATGSINVTNIDKTVPRAATISLSSQKIDAGGTVTARVTHTDNESGIDIGKCKWVYNKQSGAIGKQENLYTGGTFSSNGQSVSYTTREIGTYYLHVLSVDKVGNKTETISGKIEVTNNLPQIGSVNYGSKTTNSITINANATDLDGDKLTYELYVSTSQNGPFVKKATSPATNSGNSVSLTANTLNEYTNYYYYVTVSDGKGNPVQGGVQGPIRTYCPGNTYTCEGPFYGSYTCYYCNGTGYHDHNWRFSYIFQPTASATNYCGYGCGGRVNTSSARCSCGAFKIVPSCNNFCKEWVEAAERPTTGRCGKCFQGTISEAMPCRHGYEESHQYCAHDLTYQHD